MLQPFSSFTKIKGMANIKIACSSGLDLSLNLCSCFKYAGTWFFMNCSEREQAITCFDFWIYIKTKELLLDNKRQTGLGGHICQPFTKSCPQRDMWMLYEHGMNCNKRNYTYASEKLLYISLQTRIYPLLQFLSTSNSAHPCRPDFCETSM